MADLKSLRRNLELLNSKGDFRLQTQTVSVLLTQVREYVKQITEEEQAVRQIPELERIVRKKPATPEEEREIDEAREALNAAESLKRKIPMKKSALRKLGGEVDALMHEIRKAA